jgi:nicotinamidase-related amidase
LRARDKNRDLHGNVPDSCTVALLLVDVINDLAFPNNRTLLAELPQLVRSLVALKERCRKLRIPTIYANDNFGKWRSNFPAVLAHCLKSPKGHILGEQLAPTTDDYIVLKPKHSVFFATPLDILLSHLTTSTVILTGLTTNACILTSASELHVRDVNLFVPSDCVAGLTPAAHRAALGVMKKSFGADTRPSDALQLSRLLRKKRA